MDKYYYKYLKYKSKYLKLSQTGGNLTDTVNKIVKLLGEPIKYNNNELQYISAALDVLDMKMDEDISLEANANKVLTRLQQMNIPELAKKSGLDENSTLMQIFEVQYEPKYIDSSASGTSSTVGRLETIPQLCFGTAQGNLRNTLPIALANGIVHIDGADNYGGEEYLRIIRENIQTIPREKLWITWKSNYITKENIQRIIDSLECGYIDTFLIHHSNCENVEELEILDRLKRSGLIKHYGLSNCENINKIIELKNRFDIETVQIQARPPKGVIQTRKKINLNDFINELNKIGINAMLYGTISGITNLDDYFVVFDNVANINKYYIQKYCLGKPNILIISSISGSSIKINITDFDNIMKSEDLLDSRKMNEIESQLEQLELSFQG